MISSSELIQYIPRLRRYARALTGDASRADDLVQDTLERALAKLDLWRPGSDMRAWLFTLMHNIFVNQVRSSANQVFCELDEAADVPVSGGQQEALAVRDINAALSRLPAEQREVILLIGLEQFSYADAAHILGVAQGTVMSRLSRARERMRQLMEGKQVAKLQVVK